MPRIKSQSPTPKSQGDCARLSMTLATARVSCDSHVTRPRRDTKTPSSLRVEQWNLRVSASLRGPGGGIARVTCSQESHGSTSAFSNVTRSHENRFGRWELGV